MKTIYRILFFSVVMFISCNSDQSDSYLIEQKVTGFLKWYKQNWEMINVKVINSMIENSRSTGLDSTKLYRINFDSAELYLKIFKESWFVSDTYLSEYRDYFKKCQSDFEREPQFMGPANGFDYEFIFRGQDFRGLLENPQMAKITKVDLKKTEAVVTVRYNDVDTYFYNMSKQNGDWFIDRIRVQWELKNMNQ
jgi:hypothetical protein